MSEREAYIKKARNCHKSVRPELWNSKIILSKPRTEILHRLELPKTGKFSATQDTSVRFALHKALSGKRGEEMMPPIPDDIEMSFRNKWYSGGDHVMLMQMIDAGRLPLAWREYWTPDDPPQYQHALEIAKERGYQVPHKFLAEESQQSYSEKESFHAAYTFVSGQPAGFWGRAFWDVPDIRKWTMDLCQLTGQFIIPDPLEKTKTPYFLDQLWILLLPNRRIRLIGLEIDGENHLEADRVERDGRRDAMLAAMGYEVYHVAGWWCRIDPYLVIAEFLRASGICEVAPNFVTGAKQSINAYTCDLCHELMVRWDHSDIEQAEIGGRLVTGHRFCIRERLETEG